MSSNRFYWIVAVLAGTCGALCVSCGGKADTPARSEVTTRGSIEVTAELAEIRGEFVDKANYDYAFVMKYKVLAVRRGEIDGDTIYVGHYNPLETRAGVADARVPDIGGNVKRFRQGEVHRMALERDIDEHYMGGIINRYFGEETGPIYWAVWTERAQKL